MHLSLLKNPNLFKKANQHNIHHIFLVYAAPMAELEVAGYTPYTSLVWEIFQTLFKHSIVVYLFNLMP